MRGCFAIAAVAEMPCLPENLLIKFIVGALLTLFKPIVAQHRASLHTLANRLKHDKDGCSSSCSACLYEAPPCLPIANSHATACPHPRLHWVPRCRAHADGGAAVASAAYACLGTMTPQLQTAQVVDVDESGVAMAASICLGIGAGLCR